MSLEKEPAGAINKAQRLIEQPPMYTLLAVLQVAANCLKLPDALTAPSTYIWPMADVRAKKPPAEKLAEASKALAAYLAGEAATRANMLRLRTERLAREAANPPEIGPAPVKPKPRRKSIRRQ